MATLTEGEAREMAALVEERARYDIDTGPPKWNGKTFKITEKPTIGFAVSSSRVGHLQPVHYLYAVVMDMMRRGHRVGVLPQIGPIWSVHMAAALRVGATTMPNTDYVVSIDGDSVFTPEDVEQLIDVMQKNPDLAAVWPVQPSRGPDQPLCFINTLDYSKELTPATFGHFGCTVFRADLFKSRGRQFDENGNEHEHWLPKPWFMFLPDPNGLDEEGNGRSDDDIYLWRNLWESGYKCAQANHVQIGHFVEMVKWVGTKGAMFQTMNNYIQKGKPDPRKMELGDGNQFRLIPVKKQEWADIEGEPPPLTVEGRRLHVGGVVKMDGWDRVNVKPECADIPGTASDLSAVESESCAEVYASHVYEHLDYYNGEFGKALLEAYRVLKPGGRLRVAVPDMYALCQLFTSDKLDKVGKFGIMRMMLGGHTDAHDFHKVGLDFSLLDNALREAGFVYVRKVDTFGVVGDTSKYQFAGVRISLNVECRKPAAPTADLDADPA